MRLRSNEDSDELFFKTWASLNDHTSEYTLILIEKKIFFAIMEMVLGGEIDTESWRYVDRQVTSVEWQMYGKILDQLLRHLRETMAGICEFNVEILSDARAASNAAHVHKETHGYVTSDIYEVNVEGVTGLIKMEYPSTLIKQAMGQVFTAKTAKSHLTQLKESLEEVPLSVTGSIHFNAVQ